MEKEDDLNMDSSNEETSAAMADPSFKLRRLAIFVILVMFFLALASFDAGDLDYFAGGIDEIGYPHNWLGAIGNSIAWFFLSLFGLASYLILGVALVCSLRRLVWRDHLLKTSWGYYLAILGVGIGGSLILGLNPGVLESLCARLNISGFPGGVLGDHFCSASHGWLYLLLSSVGSLIVALVVIVMSLAVIVAYDWKDLVLDYLAYRRQVQNPVNYGDGEEDAPAQVPVQPQPQSMRPQLTREPWRTANQAKPVRQAEASSIPAMREASPRAGQPSSGAKERMQPLNADDMQEESGTSAPSPTPSHPTVEQPMRRRLTAAQVAARNANQLTLPMEEPPPKPPVRKESEYEPAMPSGEYTGDYALPSLNCLNPLPEEQEDDNMDEFEECKQCIQDTLDQCHLDAEVESYVVGPQVTLYKIATAPGMKIEKVGGYQNNFTMAVKSRFPVRMVLPILGTNLIGIEVANRHRKNVLAAELFESQDWANAKMKLPLMLGKDVSGENVMVDLQAAPHLLIAGSTGSGKSVCMFMIVVSLLLKLSPDELKLIIVDPKFVDYAPFHHLPHLLCPVLQNASKVSIPLKWAITEMNRRLDIMSRAHCQNILGYNARPLTGEVILDEFGLPIPDRLPFIVIIIDELADLMMSNYKKDIEHAIQTLGQKARAAGIHMVIATQRPDVKILTGNIKANIPYRIAFTTASQIDSRTILDEKGAEGLTGRGDMLLKDTMLKRRVQGGWIDNEEIIRIADSCSTQVPQEFNPTIIEALKAADGVQDVEEGEDDEVLGPAKGAGGSGRKLSKEEQLLHDAMEQIIKHKRATVSFVQRALQVGYNKAATIIDELEARGYISAEMAGTRGNREILKWTCPGDDEAYDDDSEYDDFGSEPSDMRNPGDDEDEASTADDAVNDESPAPTRQEGVPRAFSGFSHGREWSEEDIASAQEPEETDVPRLRDNEPPSPEFDDNTPDEGDAHFEDDGTTRHYFDADEGLNDDGED